MAFKRSGEGNWNYQYGQNGQRILTGVIQPPCFPALQKKNEACLKSTLMNICERQVNILENGQLLFFYKDFGKTCRFINVNDDCGCAFVICMKVDTLHLITLKIGKLKLPRVNWACSILDVINIIGISFVGSSFFI